MMYFNVISWTKQRDGLFVNVIETKDQAGKIRGENKVT